MRASERPATKLTLPPIQLIDAATQLLDLLFEAVAEAENEANSYRGREAALAWREPQERRYDRSYKQRINWYTGRHLHSVIPTQQVTKTDPSFI